MDSEKLFSQLRLVSTAAKNSVLRCLNTSEPESLEGLFRVVDSLGEQVSAGVGLACKKGCSFCCHFPVRVTAIEAELAWKKAKASEKFGEIEANLSESGRTACPLLVDGECSVYAHRPIACRTRNSFDAGACEKSLEDRYPGVGIASSKELLAVGNRAENGTQQAYHLANRLLASYRLREALLSLSKGEQLGESSYFKDREEEKVGYFEHGSHLDPAVEKVLNRFEGDLEELGAKAFNLLDSAPRTLQLLHRLRTPLVAESDEQIDDWRREVDRSLLGLETEEIEPHLALDELCRDIYTLSWTYHGRPDLPFRKRFGQVLHDRIVSKLDPTLVEPMPDRKPGPLRVGFISMRFKHSNACDWALGWMRAISKQPEIESYVVDLGSAPDATTYVWKGLADQYCRYEGGAIGVGRAIRALDLDVLIFTDTGIDGCTDVYGSMRLARHQVAGWGGPATSGLTCMDHFLAGELMVGPDLDASFTEKVSRLPGIGFHYPRRLIDGFKAERGTGVDGFILGVQVPPKLHPRWDSLYRSLTDNTQTGLVFVGGQRGGLEVKVQTRLNRSGVPHMWIPYLSQARYLEALSRANFNLDTPFFNGGITALHSLLAGCPILTLPGPQMRDQFGKAFMTWAGLGHWVPKDEAQYLEFASHYREMRADLEKIDLGERAEDDRIPEAFRSWLQSLNIAI